MKAPPKSRPDTWATLVSDVSAASGVSKRDVKAVLDAFVSNVKQRLANGGRVRLKGLGSFDVVWRKPRQLRRITDAQTIFVDGRYGVKFRPAKALRDVIDGLSPQHWRSTEHQSAWRLAQTLVDDLSLYAGGKRLELGEAAPDDAVRAACRRMFPMRWAEVESTYDNGVPTDVRTERDYLARAARQQFAAH